MRAGGASLSTSSTTSTLTRPSPIRYVLVSAGLSWDYESLQTCKLAAYTAVRHFPCQTHDEEIPLKKGTYKLQGYAYCGGGRQVQRMEVSLDDGKVGSITLSRFSHCYH